MNTPKVPPEASQFQMEGRRWAMRIIFCTAMGAGAGYLSGSVFVGGFVFYICASLEIIGADVRDLRRKLY